MQVGLALIAKNEEQNLPTLLASIEGAFDRVVLLDTGSEDNTRKVFQEWAIKQNGMTYSVGRFDWVNDFAAARTAADELLGDQVDWKVWADCDDELYNARVIRSLCEQAPPELAAYICDYDYAQDPNTGVSLCRLKRERIVRTGRGTWEGRVHEAQAFDGAAQFVPGEVIEWRHRKPVTTDIGERNLEILERWHEDEPDNLRVLAYLGTEHAIRGRHEIAIPYYQRYLNLSPTWDEEHAQVCRKAARSFQTLERHDDARDLALRAITVMPEWPDSYLTLCEYHLARNEPAKAMHHAKRVLELGVPQTLLIINPLDYAFLPLRHMAISLAAGGQFDPAIEHAKKALAMFPGDEVFQHLVRSWYREAKREHTAKTFAMCAEQLIAHDEQLKALTVLEQCVPHFATDHVQIVQMRASLRARLAWVGGDDEFTRHYQEDGSRKEDFIPDDKVDEICGMLPRCEFLLDGVKEQMAA